MKKDKPSTGANVPLPDVVRSTGELTSIGVYCNGKCGGIIFAVTARLLKMDKEARSELDWYRINGYQAEEMPAQKIRNDFGCTCK